MERDQAKMKTSLFLLILNSTLGFIQPFPNNFLLQEFAMGNHKFTADVYKQLSKTDSIDNFVMCPLSTEIVLSLMHSGAGGKTAEELAIALNLPQNKNKIQEMFQELSPHLQSNRNYTLDSANKIYVKSGYQITNEFTYIARNIFAAEIENINFDNPNAATYEMNRWVELQTRQKIKNVISLQDLNANTRSVLVNAIYFHGKWIQAFNKRSTREMPFYLNYDSTIYIDMMEQVTNLNYHESFELNAKFLELPYAGENGVPISMTIVLPNDNFGLRTLQDKIEEVFNISPSFYSPERVHVVLPKFKIETKINFNTILQQLGVTEAFLDDADFDQILINQPLKISQIVQKSFIEVEEEGTVAAATTSGVQITPVSTFNSPSLIRQFIADHPFIFFIKIKDVILFAGKYQTPTF